MSEVTVRPAEERDIASILEIVNNEIEHGYAHFGLEPMEYRRLLGEWREACRDYPWLVAESDGEVVGYARSSPWKSRGAYRWTTEIGVYVRPSQHRRGIGRQLYCALFPALEAAGFRTVMAGIALPNEASVRLHESFGMTKVAHMPAVGYKFGEWRDVAYWSIRIGDPNRPPHR